MELSEITKFLDEKVSLYETSSFIDSDPISIPHQFKDRGDIEVAGYLTATISWGKRSMILKSANKLMEMLDHSPYQFVINASDSEINMLDKFYYRTFQGVDLVAFIHGLRRVYERGGMELLFASGVNNGGTVREGIAAFRSVISEGIPQRTFKHLSDVAKGSSGKRFNMFLRWMVRPSAGSVDFGLWKSISPADLYLPLDVHSARVARSLGLLQRKQNDWRAVEEVTEALKKIKPDDPIKYDFALFGLGVFENFGIDG